MREGRVRILKDRLRKLEANPKCGERLKNKLRREIGKLESEK